MNVRLDAFQRTGRVGGSAPGTATHATIPIPLLHGQASIHGDTCLQLEQLKDGFRRMLQIRGLTMQP